MVPHPSEYKKKVADTSETLCSQETLPFPSAFTTNISREILYKAQVHSTLEYSPLALVGAAESHFALLGKIPSRAEKII